MNEEERIKEILSKVKKTVEENNYKLALAITGHRPGKIRDVSMSSKDGELLLDYITNLQQENTQLKENNMSMQEEMARTWEKADLYKEVIEEVKDRITIKLVRYINEKDYVIDDVALDELLQILDKAKY